MIRTTLGALAALAIAALVGAVALFAQPDVAEAQSQSATWTFQQDWAMPGGEILVTITASNYGPIGQVVETLPAEFAYAGSDLSESQVAVDGQTVTLTLLGEETLAYTVTAPAAEGS